MGLSGAPLCLFVYWYVGGVWSEGGEAFSLGHLGQGTTRELGGLGPGTPVHPLFPGLFAAVLFGCGSQSSVPTGPVVVGGLTYQGQVQAVEPDSLRGQVTIANESEAPQSVTFPDGCVVLMRAYLESQRLWDQGDDALCTMALIPVELEPGEEQTFATQLAVADILGEDLPERTYRLTLYLRRLNREEVELNAGEFELQR